MLTMTKKIFVCSLVCFFNFSSASDNKIEGEESRGKNYVGQGVAFRDIDVEVFRQGRKNKIKGDRKIDNGYHADDNRSSNNKAKCCCSIM